MNEFTRNGILNLIQSWMFIFLSSIFAIYWYSTRNYAYWSKRGIKGPPTVPFLGSFFNLKIPFPILYQIYLREYGKIVGVYQGQKPVLVVADPEIIKRILIKDFSHFRNKTAPFQSIHRIYGNNLVAARDENWVRHRTMLAPIFTSSKLKKMETIIQESIKTWIEITDQTIRDDVSKSVEIRSTLENFVMDSLAKCIFGFETNVYKNPNNAFFKNAKEFVRFRPIRFVATLLTPKSLIPTLIDWKVKPYHLETFDFFEDLLKHLIDERKKADANYSDMVQLMVNATLTDESNLPSSIADKLVKEEKRLSIHEIMANTTLSLTSPNETTTTLLALSVYELALNSNVQERLYQEIIKTRIEDTNLSVETLDKIDYLKAFISEVARKHPPNLLLHRETNQDYSIPELNLIVEKGTVIHIPTYALHHTEEYYPEPEKFDPERFMPENADKLVPYTYFPFGAGPRKCIATKFAMTFVKIAIANIVEHYQIVPTGDTPEQLVIQPGWMLLKTSPIYLKLKIRN